MRKLLLTALMSFTPLINANVIEDHNAPLLIDGKKLFPYFVDQGYSDIEARIILDLIDLYQSGDIESFCKDWGYGEGLSYYQSFLNQGSLLMLQKALGEDKATQLIVEASKVSFKYKKKSEPYFVFMKNKAETGSESDKKKFEEYICYEEINGRRMYAAAGISLAISDLNKAKEK